MPAAFERASRARPGMPEAADVAAHSLTPRQAPQGGAEADHAGPRSG